MFYKAVCAFYVAASSDMVKKFPFGEEHMILKCSRFVNFYTKFQSIFSDVEYFVHKYSSILQPNGSEDYMTNLLHTS